MKVADWECLTTTLVRLVINRVLWLITFDRRCWCGSKTPLIQRRVLNATLMANTPFWHNPGGLNPSHLWETQECLPLYYNDISTTYPTIHICPRCEHLEPTQLLEPLLFEWLTYDDPLFRHYPKCAYMQCNQMLYNMKGNNGNPFFFGELWVGDWTFFFSIKIYPPLVLK